MTRQIIPPRRIGDKFRSHDAAPGFSLPVLLDIGLIIEKAYGVRIGLIQRCNSRKQALGCAFRPHDLCIRDSRKSLDR